MVDEHFNWRRRDLYDGCLSFMILSPFFSLPNLLYLSLFPLALSGLIVSTPSTELMRVGRVGI